MSYRFVAGLLPWLAPWLVACEASESGQTGSADCGLPQEAPYCLCGRLLGVPLRVQVVSVQANRLRATVDEQYSHAYQPALTLDPGETVVGTLPFGRPCDEIIIEDDVVQTSFNGVAGDELLVLYSPGEVDRACAGDEPSSCGPAREAARLDGSFEWAVHFDAKLDFGDGAILAPESIETVLHDAESCYQAFSAAPPRCDDTLGGP